MKKTLITLTALAATAAFAQSSVTMYGVADAYVGTQKARGGVNQTVVNDGGLSQSRLGVSVKEDLGSGLNAFAVIEGVVALDAGTGGLGANRKSVVGLSGGFGTVSLGAQQTPLQDVLEGVIDAQGNSSFSAVGAAMQTNATQAQNFIAYTDSVRYDTPNFDGFSAALHATAGANNNSTRYALNLKYENGPLGAALAYESDKGLNTTTPGMTAHMKTTALGGYYDFGVAKLHLGYGRVSTTTTPATPIASNRELSVGVAVPVGAFTFVGQFAQAKASNAPGTSRSFGLEGRYALSKRTTAYAGYNNTRSTVNNPAANLRNSNRFGVGMRHIF